MISSAFYAGARVGAGDTAPVLLFCAHDRHNFGDLLFAQVAASYLPGRTLVPAGLIRRDLSACGGFRVEAIAELARAFAASPVEILHVGGEILTTTAWQAAVMLAEPEGAPALIARFDADPAGARAYAAQRFGIEAGAPYVVGRDLFPEARRIVFNAVGGADLATADAELAAEACAKLREADLVTVRDALTQQALARAGVVARLIPDPVSVIAERFAERIAQESATPDVARLRMSFPEGFVAVQFAAECGDDATLAAIAAQLDALADESGLPVVFFRAGSAPWHDDLDAYRRCRARLKVARSDVFARLEIWQIAALIATSRGFLGTSLHGHIVASAYGLPRVSFLPPSLGGRSNKIVAYLATWEMAEMPGVVALGGMAEGFLHAAAVAPPAREEHARRLASLYHQAAWEIFTS